jgi:histone deacetylase 1/2
LCVFLGYSPHHKGYLCLDRHTNHIIISRHVVFEETSFLFSESSANPTRADFDFLEGFTNPVVAPFPPSPYTLPAGSSGVSSMLSAVTPSPHASRAASPATLALDVDATPHAAQLPSIDVALLAAPAPDAAPRVATLPSIDATPRAARHPRPQRLQL